MATLPVDYCQPVALVWAKFFGYTAATDIPTIACSFHHLGEVYNIERVASSQCGGHCWTIPSPVSTMIFLGILLSPFASMLQCKSMELHDFTPDDEVNCLFFLLFYVHVVFALQLNIIIRNGLYYSASILWYLRGTLVMVNASFMKELMGT